MKLGLSIGLSAFRPGLGTPPTPAVPVITSSSISGTPEDDETLTANRTVTGYPSPTITYQWQASGTNIVGQTAQTIVLNAATMSLTDGETISCEITATNAQGSDSDEPTIAFVVPAIDALATPTLILDESGSPSDNQPRYDIDFNATYPDGAYFDDILVFQWGTSEAAAAAQTSTEKIIDEEWVLDGVDPCPELTAFVQAQAGGTVVHYRVKAIGGAHRTGSDERTDSGWSNYLTYTTYADATAPTAMVDVVFGTKRGQQFISPSGTVHTATAVDFAAGVAVVAVNTWSDTSARNITSVTIGGNAATKLDFGTAAPNDDLDWFYLPVSAGTYDVVVNLSGVIANDYALVFFTVQNATFPPVSFATSGPSTRSGVETTGALTIGTDGMGLCLLRVPAAVLPVTFSSGTEVGRWVDGYNQYHILARQTVSGQAITTNSLSSANKNRTHAVFDKAP